MNNLNNIPGEILKTSQLPDDMPTHLIGVITGNSPKTVKYSTTLFASQIASQMTDVVRTSFVYTDPTWLGSLAWSKIIGAPPFITGITGADVITALGYTPASNSTTVSINGVAYDLSANRAWTIAPGGTVGQILAKNSATNYDWSWIDNFTEDIRDTVKATQTINKGQAVYISGANGTNQLASLADYSAESTSSQTIGIAAINFATNDIGQIITQGILSGINTSAANAAGDPVYLGSNGDLIYGYANKPKAPKHLVYVGIVTRKHAVNGEIYVKVQNGYELEELHNVAIATPTNKDLIYYDSSTSLWKNAQLSTILGYTPADDSVTVKTTGSYSNPSWLTSLAWSKITGAPAFLTAAITSLNGLTGATQTFTNDTNVTIVSSGTAHAITWSGTLADSRIASASNWNTAYTNRITSLTTTGSSGAATLVSNVLNIPNYTLSGLGYTIPTLDQVTTSGNTTTNAISVGAINGTTTVAGNMINLQSANSTSFSVTSNLSPYPSGSIILNMQVNPSATGTQGAYMNFTGAYESFLNVISTNAIAGNKYWRIGNIGASNYFVIQKLNDTATTISLNAVTISSSTGNISINTTTDAGFKFDVNGTVRIQNALNLSVSATAGTSNDLFVYSTSDTTTNYQRGRLYVTGNVVNLVSEWAGTGSPSDLGLYAAFLGRGITVRRDGGTSGHIQFNVAGNSAPNSRGIYFSNLQMTSSSGIQYGMDFNGIVNQSGTGGYSIIRASIFEQSIGSGQRYLLDIGTNTNGTGSGTHTSLFNISANGSITTTGSITASSAIARGVYFNQTLVAAANNDILVGLDIQPTFTNGAFTGVTSRALRVTGNIGLVGSPTFFGTALFNDGVFFSNTIYTYRIQNNASLDLVFQNSSANVYARFFNTTGNLTLQNGGTFTDAGYRLDVVGSDARFNGIRAGLGAGAVSSNTVFGNGALNSNTTGVNNTVIGYNAGSLITTGGYNTLIGYGASSPANGFSNTLVGNNAISQGSSNTIIGVDTNSGAFSSSIILGRAATATASNQFVVGSSAYPAGTITAAVAPVINEYWTVKINGVDKKIALIA